MEGCGSSLMAFGDNNSNNSGICPMMMMPLVTSNHGHAPAPPHPINPNLINIPIPNPNPNADTNNTTCLFFPLPYSCNHSSHANNHHSNPKNSTTPGTSSSMMLHNTNDDTVTGLGYFMEIHPNNNDNDGSSSPSSSSCSAAKAKIMAHPRYHRLLAAYINCQKVGAPSEVVARLEEAYACAVRMAVGSGCMGEDPALDQFMEAYCEMLTKYHQELSKPFNEAILFLQTIESQLKSLSDFGGCNEGSDRNGSSEDDVDVHTNIIDPQAEDRELKGQLLRKYSGCLGSLKQEFMKRRKKGKLPKEARQQLLEWWSRHYKWPYPSEQQKLALAESTGLDQKQINNWFINQRKRHWRPSEDMQFVVVDPSHPYYYMDNVLSNPFPMDLSHTIL